MKKLFFLSLLTAILVSGFALDADAQSRKKKKKKKTQDEYFDERGGSFSSKLWYGASANLPQLNNTFFTVGLSPMVGYKFMENFSAGPRLGLDYLYFKDYAVDGEIHGVNIFDVSYGAFTRYKIFNGLFAHGEFERQTREYPLYQGSFVDLDDNGNINTVREGVNNGYLGLGWNFQGEFSSEIYVLYNFLEPENSLRIPFYLRFGFTYRF